MKTYSISELRKHFGEILRIVEEDREHIFITRYGEVIAVLVPVEDAEALYISIPEES